MTKLTPDKLLDLRDQIEQQRKTIEALKRDGHICDDAERQLQFLLAQLQASEKAKWTA